MWDSSAEVRYLVLPLRPAGTEGLSEDELVPLVDPRPHDRAPPGDGPCLVDGHAGDGPARGIPRSNGELVFDAPWESRAFGLAAAYLDTGGEAGTGSATTSWPPSPSCPDAPYYEAWVTALERLLAADGVG